MATITPIEFDYYAPTDACFDWCIEQQVVHANNLELYAVAIVGVAYVFILLYEMDSINFFKRYQPELIYMAKLMLIIFFIIYILVIRLRVWY